ncbi:MAG: TolC family protein [Myxococcota bacterium]
MKRLFQTSPIFAGGAVLLMAAGQPASADEPELPASGPIVLQIEEAVELALTYSFALRQARLDAEDIDAQVSQSWSDVWPRVDGTASYTRNLTAPNPFAGTGAGGAFNTFDSLGWLVYNEQQRTIPDGQPLSLQDYIQRQNDALANAGIITDPDANPFLVENQVNLSLVVRQVLYDGAVFAGVRGSKVAKDIALVGIDVESLNTVRQVSSTFYGALLSARQTEILEKSVARTQSTVDETKKRVQQGVVPRFELLTAEVELANLQTRLARAKNAAARAIDDLRLAIGLPPGPPLKPKGELTLENAELTAPSSEEAVIAAFENRPDFKQATLNVEAGELQEDATFGKFLPKLSAIANLGYLGSIPDNRSFAVSANNIDDPFELRREESGVFSDAFWFSSISVGLTLEWNIFEGFATWNQLKRDRVATRKSRVQLEQARTTIQVEVEQSLRELNTAQQQIETQERNRERAELNYGHAQVRVREGVSNQFELRQASEQLDESRFNYLQAVHDYLVARIGYLVAIGTPPVGGSKSK